MLKVSQEEIVLHHLTKIGVISSWEAIQKYRITRLGAVIFNLRRAGHDIRTTVKQSIQAGKHFAEYTLEPTAQTASQEGAQISSEEQQMSFRALSSEPR